MCACASPSQHITKFNANEYLKLSMNILPHDTAQTHKCCKQARVYKIAVVHVTYSSSLLLHDGQRIVEFLEDLIIWLGLHHLHSTVCVCVCVRATFNRPVAVICVKINALPLLSNFVMCCWSIFLLAWFPGLLWAQVYDHSRLCVTMTSKCHVQYVTGWLHKFLDHVWHAFKNHLLAILWITLSCRWKM